MNNKITTMTIKDIAVAFSNGKFEMTYPHLAEEAEWNIIGENRFTGKEEIIKYSKQIADYFNSITTDFVTTNILSEHRMVAVAGTATFIRDNQQVGYTSACDLYEFNGKNQLVKISSYCIQQKK
jgi:hypothetical protein